MSPDKNHVIKNKSSVMGISLYISLFSLIYAVMIGLFFLTGAYLFAYFGSEIASELSSSPIHGLGVAIFNGMMFPYIFLCQPIIGYFAIKSSLRTNLGRQFVFITENQRLTNSMCLARLSWGLCWRYNAIFALLLIYLGGFLFTLMSYSTKINLLGTTAVLMACSTLFSSLWLLTFPLGAVRLRNTHI